MTGEQQVELGEQAFRAFERELPQLWEERPGQWVAYRGEERLGFATQKHELYQRCFEQGLAADEFFIFCIEPFEDVVYFGVLPGTGVPMSRRRISAAVHRSITIPSLDRCHSDTAIAPMDHHPAHCADGTDAAESALGVISHRLGP